MNTSQFNTKEEPWVVMNNGFFKTRISKLLKENDIPEDSIEGIFENAGQILSKCPNPQSTIPVGKTGIVIGKVQSGKTSNFISLMALAMDNSYEVMVVLGGNKINLLAQNTLRIKQSFGESDKLVVLDTNVNKNLISPATIKTFLDSGKKVIIVGLKHQKHINFLANLYDDIYLRSMPTLIIDDEGDQASLNTYRYKNKMSPIYASIKNLKEKIDIHCFISVTATPQANILSDITDFLSPSFGSLVYPGNNYCGLMTFHGEDQDIYIKEISDEEPSLLDEELPSSFFEALAIYFVGGTLRQYRGDNGAHSMLIHPSQKKYDHRIVINKVKNILDDWRAISSIRLDNVTDLAYTSLRSHLYSAYLSLLNDGVVLPPFEQLELNILKNIKICSPVHLFNSDEPANDNDKYYKFNIYVGGNMVERGITLKGLAVTYITRRAKGVSNVDNTEQRARWFGYKQHYLDVCRVYTTKVIKKDFSSILEHDEDLWATIERAESKGTPFKEIPRVFVLNDKMLRLTRTTVARTSKFSQISEWKKQNKFLFNEDASNKNKVLIELFKEKNIHEIEFRQFNGGNKHAMLKNIDFYDLNKSFLQNFEFPNGSNLNHKYLNKIEELLKKSKIDAKIDILWIREETGQTRSVHEDSTISELFQGRNPNLSSPTYYDGDNALANEREVMQLQIHYVKPKNIEVTYYTPMLALYIPNSYSSQMVNLVIED
ncbi:MAG: hypothetical protein JSY10_14805 [Paenibacillus sp.]|nr:hypothetical protein [Paenibacillus sp.]